MVNSIQKFIGYRQGKNSFEGPEINTSQAQLSNKDTKIMISFITEMENILNGSIIENKHQRED